MAINRVPNWQMQYSNPMNRYYLSQPTFSSPVGFIDKDQGIIYGVTVAKTGPARGHNGMIDKTFLLQLVDMANARPQGIKARFGHPNMCSTALGTYLGRFHNYAYQTDKVTADLHLDPSAKDTPHGNLFDYILNMAESNPDMFGASVVFESDAMQEKQIATDEATKTQRFFRLKELRATDIVDDPAATDGLFSAESLPGQATQWLDQNPELSELIFSKPDRLIEFLNNYLNNSNMNLSEKIKSNFRKIFSLELDEGIKDQLSQDNGTSDTDTSSADQQEDSLIKTAFSNFVADFPELGITSNEDSSFSIQLDEQITQLSAADMLETMLGTTQSLLQELMASKAVINQLSDKLAAKPTIPAQVSDPQVSAKQDSPEKDETGKQILKSIPAEMRYRLRNLTTKQP